MGLLVTSFLITRSGSGLFLWILQMFPFCPSGFSPVGSWLETRKSPQGLVVQSVPDRWGGPQHRIPQRCIQSALVLLLQTNPDSASSDLFILNKFHSLLFGITRVFFSGCFSTVLSDSCLHWLAHCDCFHPVTGWLTGPAWQVTNGICQ